MSCAAIQSPSGGPKDETPPTLVSTLPENGVTNFSGRKIELQFSEYLKESSIQKSIQILPALENQPIFIYQGKKVILELEESLKSNQTYIVLINRSLMDEHNLKISKSVQIAFSTGSKIDDGLISGKVEYSKKASLNLWKIKDSSDVTTFYTRSPDYTVDASDSGFYEFKYLSQGDYRISLVDQSVSGSPLFPERMLYGLSWLPLIKIKEGTMLEGVNLRMPQKKNSLKINSVDWINGQWGTISFSDNYLKEPPLTFFNENKESLGYSVFRDPLHEKKLNFFIEDTLTSYTTIFSEGVYDDSLSNIDSARLRVKVEAFLDTNNIKVIHPDEKFILDIEVDNKKSLDIIFSSLMDTTGSEKIIKLYEDSTEIKFDLKWISPLFLKLTPTENWKEKMEYRIEFNRELLIPLYAQNLKDSLLVINFKTSLFQKFGTLNLFAQNTFNKRFIGELSEIKNNDIKYNVSINSDTVFKIEKILEGNYLLMLYRDKDKSNNYTYGNLDPYHPAEWFFIYPDTIQIRSNWDLDLRDIDLGVK